MARCACLRTSRRLLPFCPSICVGLALVALLLVPACDRLSTLKVPEIYDGCEHCSLIVRQIAWSIDHDPTDWSTDGFLLCRNGGWLWSPDACVWIANDAYGIEIGPRSNTVHLQSEEERALLWRATQRWLTNGRNY